MEHANALASSEHDDTEGIRKVRIFFVIYSQFPSV